MQAVRTGFRTQDQQGRREEKSARKLVKEIGHVSRNDGACDLSEFKGDLSAPLSLR